MRKKLFPFILAAAAFAVAIPAVPAFAGECEGMRQFTGAVQGFKKGKKGRFVLDNRQGDKVKFVKPEAPKIVDERSDPSKPKAEWSDLKNGDYVSVCWKFTDNPRQAYTIYVMDKPKDSAVDE